MVGYIAGELRYNLTPVERIFEDLAACERYRPFGFLQAARDRMRTKPFPEALRGALLQDAPRLALHTGDVELLEGLADSLGASDVSTQLAYLALLETRLQERLEAAKEAQRSKGRMYRTLGVLCGIVVDIIIL